MRQVRHVLYLGCLGILLSGWIVSGVCFGKTKPPKPAAPPPPVKAPAKEAEGSLKWADLVGHPERWPATTKVLKPLDFGSGDLIQAGTAVHIVNVTAKDVQLLAPQGFAFQAVPADCDLLAAANSVWLVLTPEQRALTGAAIAKDPSLWPGKATVTNTLTFGKVKINAGDTLPLLRIDATEAAFYKPGQDDIQIVPLASTDIFKRSRSLLKMPHDERPGRMAAVFESLTIDVNRKPVVPNAANYYVLYYASSTCPRCAVFTPKLLDHFNQVLATRTDVTFITTGTDATLAPYLGYVKQTGMPWPILPHENYSAIKALGDPGVVEIPGVIVFDKYGTVLLSTAKMNGSPMGNAETALVKLDDTLKPAPAKVN